jgi:hypothetical protein
LRSFAARPVMMMEAVRKTNRPEIPRIFDLETEQLACEDVDQRRRGDDGENDRSDEAADQGQQGDQGQTRKAGGSEVESQPVANKDHHDHTNAAKETLRG